MFVYSHDDKSFYKCLNEYDGTFTKIFMIMIQAGMNWKTVNTSRIFSIEFRVTLPTYLLQGHWLIAVWTWAAETRVSWWCQIFHKIIICIKIFSYFKKTIIFLVNFGISQFATDSPWENFLVYVLLVGSEPESFWFRM